jgi:phage terminase large subunit-like protein
MPWQREWLDVVGEYDPVTGIPYYREASYSTPRQSGKTSVLLSWAMHRGLGWGSTQRIAWTAQSGKDAAEKWVDELYPLIEDSPLYATAVRALTRANGKEAIKLRNGSIIRLVANTESSGHGKTLHGAVLDEIFDDTDNRREQALVPALATTADAQVLVCSTAGTAASTLFNQKRAAGRRAVLEGWDRDLCYLEYSAPDGWDPHDEESWWAFMPALGHTITPAAVRHALLTMEADESKGVAEFKRAYGNIPTAGADEVIPEPVWRRVCDARSTVEGRLVYGVAVSQDRSSAAIAVADPSGRVELIRHEPGVAWVVEAANTLRHPGEVVLDSGGPAGALADSITGCRGLTAREVVQACGAMFDAIVEAAGVRVMPHPALDAAVRGVAKRQVGDAFVWSRKGSSEDVAPFEAVTLAWWAARARQVTAGYVGIDL